MTAESILEYWQLVHGPLSLSPEHAATFLTRPEVARLTELHDNAVPMAIGRHRRLRDIEELAEKTSWWFEGQPCEGDNLPYCDRCKPHPYPKVVVITRGWGHALHRSDDCVWLHRGQGSVERRGGQPAPVERVAIQVAIGLGKMPCQHCFPSTGEAAA